MSIYLFHLFKTRQTHRSTRNMDVWTLGLRCSVGTVKCDTLVTVWARDMRTVISVDVWEVVLPCGSGIHKPPVVPLVSRSSACVDSNTELRSQLVWDQSNVVRFQPSWTHQTLTMSQLYAHHAKTSIISAYRRITQCNNISLLKKTSRFFHFLVPSSIHSKDDAKVK